MQGFNMGRYVPPDQEGLTTGNKLHKKRAPGTLNTNGTQTVRFEMPFNIFCGTCEGHIAQGVRFNAEKRKVGNYYSTPIWSFTMKHISCGGTVEVRTDPKNTAYVVHSGGRKLAGQEREDVGIIRVVDPNAPGPDAFALLEKKADDLAQKSLHAPRIQQLQHLSDRQWSDPYEHSRKMRRIFREERTRLATKAASNAAIQERLGLGIELLDESPRDAQLAKLVDFGLGDEERMMDVHGAPLFGNKSPTPTASPSPHDNPKHSTKSTTSTSSAVAAAAARGDKKKTKAEIAAEKTRLRLGESLRKNTRQRIDPFLNENRAMMLPSSSFASGMGMGMPGGLELKVKVRRRERGRERDSNVNGNGNGEDNDAECVNRETVDGDTDPSGRGEVTATVTDNPSRTRKSTIATPLTPVPTTPSFSSSPPQPGPVPGMSLVDYDSVSDSD